MTEKRDDAASAATDCSAACPGFSSIYEWINYWESGSTQHESDKLTPADMRAELAWASQTISHMLASLREVSEARTETHNVYRVAAIGENAIAEYGLTRHGGHG